MYSQLLQNKLLVAKHIVWQYTIFKKFGFLRLFKYFWKCLLLTKAAGLFIHLIKNTVILWNIITVKFCYVFENCNLSSMSHNPSEMILICWFGAQCTFLVIIKVENSFLIFFWKLRYLFSRILWWIEFSTEQHLFKIKIFCKNIIVFTFD